MTKIEYKLGRPNPAKSPKGKIPYVAIEGKLVGDSGIIIEMLEAKSAAPLDAHLSPQEKAVSRAFVSLFEDSSFFALSFLRWGDEHSYKVVREYFLSILPKFFGHLILGRLRKDIVDAARAQGMGRHTHDEIHALAKANLQAFSDHLGNKKFFNGDKVTTLDATSYGFLMNMLYVPWECEIKTFANTLPNLHAYCQRMTSLYWN